MLESICSCPCAQLVVHVSLLSPPRSCIGVVLRCTSSLPLPITCTQLAMTMLPISITPIILIYHGIACIVPSFRRDFPGGRSRIVVVNLIYPSHCHPSYTFPIPTSISRVPNGCRAPSLPPPFPFLTTIIKSVYWRMNVVYNWGQSFVFYIHHIYTTISLPSELSML